MEQTGVGIPHYPPPDASLSRNPAQPGRRPAPDLFFVNGEGGAALYYPGYQDKEGWISTIQSVLATLEGES